MNRAHALAIAAAVAVTSAPLIASAKGGEDAVDLKVIHRIKAEAFNSGKVMDHLFWITDANGPRLTNSPGYRSAADWIVRALKSWGVGNAHLEKWGRFGRGWQLTRFDASLQKPVYAPLHGQPLAWSVGTNGTVTAPVAFAPLFRKGEEDERRSIPKRRARVQKYIADHKGQLRGKIVLLSDLREFDSPPTPGGKEPPPGPPPLRYDDMKLSSLSVAPEETLRPQWSWPLEELPTDPKKRAALFANLPTEVLWDYFERLARVEDPLYAFFQAEGVVAVLTTSERGDGGVIFAEDQSDHATSKPLTVPSVVLAPEPYNRLVRLSEHKVATEVALDVGVKLDDSQPDGFNVVAELPGRKKRDEVVMLGGHLDSWHTGTGATDNGAGSAVALEAFRILKALDLPMDRTVRLGLWSGEEEGLYGSRGYVQQHFGDPVTMKLKPEHAKLSGYFNLDNGSGKIRGVYLQGNDMMRPIFESWLAPFKDEGANTITIRNTGGTDHQSFDAVGLPGFQFIQDPLDYSSRTHHSELDVYDHANPSDLMQAAAIMASVVYAAANRPELLPRKELPKPLPPKVAR